MARKFVSPGVFTQELDQSHLASGVAGIGAGVIGLTQKGPAFVPTVVSGFDEFVTRFGDLTPSMQLPYAAKNYLANSDSITVVRVLGSKNGNSTLSNGSKLNVYAITGTLSSSAGGVTGTVLAWIHAPASVTATISGTPGTSNFSYTFTGSFGLFAGTASFNPTAANYIGAVFNDDPTKVGTYGHYIFKNYQWAHEGKLAPTGTSWVGVVMSGNTGLVAGAATVTSSYDYDFTTSTSPMVQSQPFGNVTYNLFQLATIAAGAASTTDVKVSIANILPSTNANYNYGSFDVIVRAFSDTDNRMIQLETFTGCNLDPTSDNFVSRRIGDQIKIWDYVNKKNTISGSYPAVSKYIRVILAGSNYDQTALPWGHAGYPDNTVAGSAIADVPFVMNNLDVNGNVERGNIWGADFTQDGVSDRLKANAAPGTIVTGQQFSLIHVTSSMVSGTTTCVYDPNATGTTPALAAQTNSAVAPAYNGFTVGFFGGFDGWNLTDANPYSAPTAISAQQAAIDVISNPDEIDINLLAAPGVTTPQVTDYMRNACSTRGDCLAIIDVPGSSVSDVIGQLNSRGIDDNYAACYYPNLKISDTTNNVLTVVSPSVAVLGAIAYSDRVKAPYFAPAGLNRGGLAAFGVVDAVDRLTFEDRNDLYEANINPIATFPNEGIVVFGQKTLQTTASALDRINVRRLLIYAKKTIASSARYLLFEPNNQATWQRFLNSVNPILDAIRLNNGLQRFKVVMDSTTNTPDLVDRNIMTGKIFLQPTLAAEYIDLSFVITSAGVAFGE